MEHKFELTFGYEDKDGKVHREVTIGRRTTMNDVFLLDADPRSERPTQRADMFRALAITKFGELRLPINLAVLLSLNSVDRDDLEQGVNRFFEISQEDREFDHRSATEVKVLFGFDVAGTNYDVVEIGRLTTGRDEVDAEAKNLSGYAKEAFLLGRMISKISTDDGTAAIDGPIDIDMFRSLDTADFELIRRSAKLAEAFFRNKGRGTRKDGDAESGSGAVAGDGNERAGNTVAAEDADTQLPEGNKRAKISRLKTET